MVKLGELKKKYKEELKKEVTELPSMEEEVEELVIDVGATRGGLGILYAVRAAYVVDAAALNKILSVIERGRFVKVRLKRFKFTRRATDVEILEEISPEEADVPEEKVLQGRVEIAATYVRFITDAGGRYYLSEGTANYERLIAEHGGETFQAILIFSSAENRGNYYRVRGFYVIPLIENKGAKEEGESFEAEV